jgi:hypothetical protein
MGEWSRRIGEVGEEIVGEFFELIGWSNSRSNLNLPCMKRQRHQTGANPRTTHGIDYLFSYESTLCDRTLEHLVVSVKYTLDPYPANPSTKFKGYFSELARTMECFKKSEIRQSSNIQFYGIDEARDIGVLFWLTGNVSGVDNIIQEVAGVRNIDEFSYDSIYIVDNKCVGFIYYTLKYLSTSRPDSEIEFFYPSTGKNHNPISRESSGKILPVEFINSNILPLKLINKKDKSKTFVLSVTDNFHRDYLKRLIGLAHEMTADFVNDTLILFPDFNQLLHENQVNEAKSSFKDQRFTESVRVFSYRLDFRNIGNE